MFRIAIIVKIGAKSSPYYNTFSVRTAGFSSRNAVSPYWDYGCIWSLVQALEAKDTYARKHSENVVVYSVGIA